MVRPEDAKVLSNGNLLLAAGQETTNNLIGSGLLALLREPDQVARLGGLCPRER